MFITLFQTLLATTQNFEWEALTADNSPAHKVLVIRSGREHGGVTRFQEAFPNAAIVYLIHTGRDHMTDISQPGSQNETGMHVFADINDRSVLEKFQDSCRQLFHEIWFDYGLVSYTLWRKNDWDCLLSTLHPKGFLVLNMPAFHYKTFHPEHARDPIAGIDPSEKQERRLGFSHTPEQLRSVFGNVLLKETADGLFFDGRRKTGYFSYTYGCSKGRCDHLCWAQPICSTQNQETLQYEHDSTKCTGTCQAPARKVCTHGDDQCNVQCIDKEQFYRAWDQLRRATERDLHPGYLAYAQRFFHATPHFFEAG